MQERASPTFQTPSHRSNACSYVSSDQCEYVVACNYFFSARDFIDSRMKKVNEWRKEQKPAKMVELDQLLLNQTIISVHQKAVEIWPSQYFR